MGGVPNPYQQQKKGLSAGAIIAIVVGAIVFSCFGLGVVGIALGEGETTSDDTSSAVDAPETENEAPAAEDEAEPAPKKPAKAKKPKPTDKPEPEADVEEEVVEEVEEEPQVMRVTATKMLDDYEANEAAADDKYSGKELAVTGIVSKVDTELFDSDKYVVMINDGSEFAFLSVNCNGLSRSEASKVSAGSKITVRGELDDGGDLGVELKSCEIA